MSKRRRSTNGKQSETRTPQRPRTQPQRPRVQQPSGSQQQRVQPGTTKPRDRFGTNPAPHETHVNLPPELQHPKGGDGGYLDGFENTMYA